MTMTNLFKCDIVKQSLFKEITREIKIGVGGRSAHLPPGTHQKMDLQVEQFSLKTNWRLEEDYYTMKTVRKTHMELARKERETIGSGPVTQT